MTKRITIIGAGFAALAAAQKCRQKDGHAEITLIAPKAEFVFLPSLIWIPSGLRKASDIILPLQHFFERLHLRHHQGAATSLRQGGRIVVTDTGEVENDGLIIACGGRFIKKLPGIEHAITPCEGIEAAEKIRTRLRSLSSGTIACGFSGNPKEPSAMRGGPMFEFLFGIDKQLRREKRRGNFRLVFFCPAPRPGIRLGEQAVDRLLQHMAARNIDVHIGHKLKGFDSTSVHTEGGSFDADLILFMPGMTGNVWFSDAGLPLSEGGMIRADKFCRVEGLDRVYVAGDAGSYPGPDWKPKQAHMAELQARAAAVNLHDELKGRAPRRAFKTELLCIIDSLNKGSMVWRTENRSLMLPPMRILHFAKRLFEQWHIWKYR